MSAGKAPHFERVALIGIGLINGSLALNLRRHRLADEIVACARREATLARARELRLADRTTTDPAAAVAGGFTTVCCMPNTRPPLDTPDLVKFVQDQARAADQCRVVGVDGRLEHAGMAQRIAEVEPAIGIRR